MREKLAAKNWTSKKCADCTLERTASNNGAVMVADKHVRNIRKKRKGNVEAKETKGDGKCRLVLAGEGEKRRKKKKKKKNIFSRWLSNSCFEKRE